MAKKNNPPQPKANEVPVTTPAPTPAPVVNVIPYDRAMHGTLLSQIVAQTNSPQEFGWHAKTGELGAIVIAGYAEVNDGMTDGNGQFATRATDAGKAEAAAIAAANAPAGAVAGGWPAPGPVATTPAVVTNNATAVATAPKTRRQPVDASKIVMGTSAVLPAAPVPFGGRGRKSSYPFDDLPAPQSANGPFAYFFVPNDPTREQPARKFLSATISAQNKKAKEAAKPGVTAPQFKAYDHTENGVAGAAVYRIA